MLKFCHWSDTQFWIQSCHATVHATVPSSVSFVSDKSQTGFGGAGVWFGEACGSYMEGDWSLAIDDRIDRMDRWVALPFTTFNYKSHSYSLLLLWVHKRFKLPVVPGKYCPLVEASVLDNLGKR